MPIEFVKVTFPTDRFVYIDDEQNGKTNDVLRVDAGTHIFDLGNLKNYRPAQRKVVVQDTTVLEPMVIAFFRKDA
jgi:hypothetical protein